MLTFWNYAEIQKFNDMKLLSKYVFPIITLYNYQTLVVIEE